MRTFSLILLTLCFVITTNAQYYYNNIIRNQFIQEQLKEYKSANIKQVIISSQDDRGEKMEDFSSNIQLSQQFKNWKSTTQSWEGLSITQHEFNEAGQLIQTMDSSLNTKQITQYHYEAGKLARIQLKSFSRGVLGFESNQEYKYKGDLPHQLLILQKGYDTITVEFIQDESGRISEEKIRKGKLLHQTYYYYYNNQDKLTDVVRFHSKANQFLPDFVFEYHSNGKLSSMLSTTDDKRDYQLWKYSYDEKGLKTMDVCTGKQNRLIGKVMYQYK